MKKLVPAFVRLLLSSMLLAGMLVALVGCGDTGAGTDTQSEMNSETESNSASETETESDVTGETETGTQTENTGTENTGTENTEPESTDSEQTTESESEEIIYTYSELDQTMWATTGVNVRSMPNTEGIKLGILAQGQEVKVTGKCNENGWYRVEYNGATGYVSGSYLSTEKVENTDAPVPGTPNLTVDNSKDVLGKSPKKIGSLYVIGNAAFEGYSYNDDRGTSYADLITKVADSLKGVSNVYCMPIPLGSGVMLPEEYAGKVSVGDQEAAIDSVLGHMGSNVLEVNIFDTLYEHRDEYLYFRTDHHWTQLGAYYAYTEFCKQKGITAHSLDDYEQVAYDGFVGSFYFSYYENYKSTVNVLYNAPDIVYTYHPISNAKMTVTASDGSTYAWPIIKDVNSYKTGVKYSCFIAGDNPFTVIENKDITDGSVCVIVKESYGNAFVPYLVDHYQTIYVIDQRYWSGNVIDFARSKSATDVIFANNLTAIGSKSQIANFKKIIE